MFAYTRRTAFSGGCLLLKSKGLLEALQLPQLERGFLSSARLQTFVDPREDQSVTNVTGRFSLGSISGVSQPNRGAPLSLPGVIAHQLRLHSNVPSAMPPIPPTMSGTKRPGHDHVILDHTQPPPAEPVRPLFIDTLQLLRKLEETGLSTDQAEALTESMVSLLGHSAERMQDSYVTKPDLEKAEIKHESTLQLYRHDFKQYQENEFARMKREIDRLKVECENLRAELKHEMDKTNAGQRLDLNLERGRMREELSVQDKKLTKTATLIDKDINEMRTSIETMKNEVIKYCVGTIMSATAIALGLLRVFM
mmetsp:Transcript_925/g.1656  ORF Transcript_925/g.1656 Transcript_925/m.1656 type:complete len:309 (-) Transcript_925:210-1136(-)